MLIPNASQPFDLRVRQRRAKVLSQFLDGLAAASLVAFQPIDDVILGWNQFGQLEPGLPHVIGHVFFAAFDDGINVIVGWNGRFLFWAAGQFDGLSPAVFPSTSRQVVEKLKML